MMDKLLPFGVLCFVVAVLHFFYPEHWELHLGEIGGAAAMCIMLKGFK